MRAVVYHGAREVSVEEVPDARIERPTDVLVKVGLVNIAALLTAMTVLVPAHGALGAAWSHLAAGVVTLPFSYLAVAKIAGIRLRDLVACAWRPVAASGVMCLAVWFAPIAAGGDRGSYSGLLIGLVITVCWGAIAYGIALALLWLVAGLPQSGERIVLRMLGRGLSIFRRRPR